VDDEQPSALSMIAMVAIVVAITILVFFAVGYVLGRIFLS
jgi:preprotein translocase subunit SecE